jgi:hypothetical protein
MKPTGTVALAVLFALGGLAVDSLSAPQQSHPVVPGSASASRIPKISDAASSASRASGLAIGNTSNPANTSGTPLTVGPVVTPTTTSPEADEAIAMDPTNPANMVAVVSDFSLGGSNTTKFAVSYGNGSAGTWSEGFVPLNPGRLATSDGRTWDANSNPVVAIDESGRVYIAGDYLNANDSANGLYVSVGNLGSSNLGLTAGNTIPVATNLATDTTVHEDKVWIAVDNSNAPTSGNVYIVWARFIGDLSIGAPSYIYFSRSTDHGQTWSSPLKVNDPAHDGGVQGPQVAVGPKGEVYVAYEGFFGPSLRQIFLVKSTDGGQTFSLQSVAVTPFFNEPSFSSSYRKNSFPSLAVSPTNGHVYVVYSDQADVNASSEPEFVSSRDRGATFSAPVSIANPSAGEQFMPAVTADGSGTIFICWFDTRNNPNSADTYDIYATSSVNNGNKFSSDTRVTPSSINAGGASFIGDYLGIAAGGGFAHPVWTSGGFNNGFLQTATLH